MPNMPGKTELPQLRVPPSEGSRAVQRSASFYSAVQERGVATQLQSPSAYTTECAIAHARACACKSAIRTQPCKRERFCMGQVHRKRRVPQTPLQPPLAHAAVSCTLGRADPLV
jgi:hypothetical protein